MHVDFRDLTFGIEVEFTRIRRSVAANIVADFFDTRPIQRGGWGFDIYDIKDQSGRVWKVVKDGSIQPDRNDNNTVIVASDDYACELVSPVLIYSDIPLLQDLIRDLRQGGAATNQSCGLHVHVGAEAFNANSLRVLCNIIFSKQSILSKAVNVNSNRVRYCKDLSDEFIQKLNRSKPQTFEKFAEIWYQGVSGSNSRRMDHYNDSRYQCLNLHQLFSNRYKTVEFRLFNSTLHAGKVKAYVQLSLLIVAQALSQKKASSRVTVAVNEKYFFRIFLLRLGAISGEFKTMRQHLLKHLSGNSAWKDPPIGGEANHQSEQEAIVM